MGACRSPKKLISVSSGNSINGIYFYNALFERLGISASYTNATMTAVTDIREIFEHNQLFGASIAAPFKIDIIPYLDKLTVQADLTGSVNSVRFCTKDGLVGHNTDYEAALELFSDWLNGNNFPNVEIYGAGGVVVSIVKALKEVKPLATISLHCRNARAGIALCKALEIEWKSTPESSHVDLWINATPATQIEPNTVGKYCINAKTVFDLVGNQGVSEFEYIVSQRQQPYLRGFSFYRLQFLRQFFFYFETILDNGVFDEIANRRVIESV